MRSDECTCVLCATHVAERRVYWQCAVLSSFAYDMNAFEDIVLIFAPFCRYWDGLHMQVKTFVPSPLFQSLCNTGFC